MRQNQMKEQKKTWQQVAYALFFLVVVLVLFYIYTTLNRERIQEQNRVYAEDSARQTVNRIESEFDNALQRVQNSAYLVSTGGIGMEVNVRLLKGLEENTTFDTVCFVNAQGFNLASGGETNDSSDREFFARGMQGESGLEIVTESRITGKPMMTFYAPVYYGNEIVGMFLGLYYAEDYLRNMLYASYFGEDADVYLCTQEGQVIASSGEGIFGDDLLDYLMETDVIDTGTAEKARTVFTGGGGAALLCDEGCKTDNLCVMHLEGHDYVLVQVFPKNVTQRMMQRANMAGVILEICLLVLFVLYIAFLVIRSGRRRKVLELENKTVGEVLRGVNILFSSRYLMVDLDKDHYSYIAGIGPLNASIPMEGVYSEFIKLHAADIIGDEAKEEFTRFARADTLRESLATKDSAVHECHVCRNGKEDWEHLIVVCLERRDARPVRVLYVRQNITELKLKELSGQRERAILNRKERQYKIAIMSNSFSTFECNLSKDRIEQDITRMYDGEEISLLERAGLSAPCSVTECFEGWMQFVLPESLEDYSATVNVEYLKEQYEQGHMEVDVDYWGGENNGVPMCVRQSFFMTLDEDTGDLIAMVVSRDITEQVRKQREQTQALQDALMQAQHANQAKTTFLSNMSHDIRTPLNAIVGYAKLLLERCDDPKVIDYAGKIKEAGEGLFSIIKESMEVTWAESGKAVLTETNCNIEDIIHEVADSVSLMVEKKHLDFCVDCNDIRHKFIYADTIRLKEIVGQLLDNAIKYTDAGGYIRLAVREENSAPEGYAQLAFVVEDNGIGISDDFKENLFQAFARERNTTMSKVLGAGLGLTVVKTFVDMMEGTVNVESKTGAGSKFMVKILFRLGEESKEEETGQAPALDRLSLVGKRVLLVEDNELNAEIAEELLTQSGFVIESAANGQMALEKVRDSKPGYYCAVLMDIQMPVMDGYEATRRIRKLENRALANIPIIALSANAFPEDQQKSLESGMDAHFSKPIEIDGLIDLLCRVLAQVLK